MAVRPGPRRSGYGYRPTGAPSAYAAIFRRWLWGGLFHLVAAACGLRCGLVKRAWRIFKVRRGLQLRQGYVEDRLVRIALTRLGRRRVRFLHRRRRLSACGGHWGRLIGRRGFPRFLAPLNRGERHCTILL